MTTRPNQCNIGNGNLVWTILRHRSKSIIAAVVIFSVGYACGLRQTVPGISDGFVKVKVSDTRGYIRELLGTPHRQESSHLPGGPSWGPTEGLESILQPGAPYEQWQWFDARDTYYVWFAARNQEPFEEWLVVAKGRHPTGAVFERAR